MDKVKVSELIEAIGKLGKSVNLETVLPALIEFIEGIGDAAADGKISIGEWLTIASKLMRVVEAARIGVKS